MLGFELHIDGADDGDVLALGFEAEPHNRPFDGLDQAKSLRVLFGILFQIVVVRDHGESVAPWRRGSYGADASDGSKRSRGTRERSKSSMRA